MILQVFIAYLLVKFSQPLTMINSEAAKRPVPLKVRLQTSSELHKYEKIRHTSDSFSKIEQAFKDYDEILRRYELENSSQDDGGPQTNNW